MGYVRGLVARGAEACFLLRTLSEHHMPRLVSRLDEPIRARLQPLKLRDWVCSHEGESVAAQLISVLVTEHLSASGAARTRVLTPASQPLVLRRGANGARDAGRETSASLLSCLKEAACLQAALQRTWQLLSSRAARRTSRRATRSFTKPVGCCRERRQPCPAASAKA